MVRDVTSTSHPIDDSLVAKVWRGVGGHANDAHSERFVLLTLRRLLQASSASLCYEANLAEAQRRIDTFLTPVPAANHGCTEDPLHEALLAWAAAARLDDIRVALCRFNTTGRGLACTSVLAQGDVALSVPLRLLLTADMLHPRVAKALDEASHAAGSDALRNEMALALTLLVETAKVGSPWWHYGRLLPSRPPCALLWTKEQLAAMGATPLPLEVAAVRRELRVSPP